ncbi:hypothetical protein JG688_00001794 [Phytophthora aleatoria]|nr:hypothetical protein JG688_00001794 [Phytophthora aleatoria]
MDRMPIRQKRTPEDGATWAADEHSADAVPPLTPKVRSAGRRPRHGAQAQAARALQ